MRELQGERNEERGWFKFNKKFHKFVKTKGKKGNKTKKRERRIFIK